MPTSRKRIGFLPSAEVQNIIDKISERNNISQSKVTGILVEEALKARNLYRLKTREDLERIDFNNDIYKSCDNNKYDYLTSKNKDIEDENEYNLIKEYLNYKNFKKILSMVQSDG